MRDPEPNTPLWQARFRAPIVGFPTGRKLTVAGTSDRGGFDVFVSESGGPAKLVAHSPEGIDLGGSNAMMAGPGQGALSADETLLAIEHSEHGDVIHPSLRVLD